MEKLYFFSLFVFINVFSILHAQSIRYVKQDATGSGNSWEDASSDLQAMINISEIGDKVYVASGVYFPQYAPSPNVYQWLTNNLLGEVTDRDKTFVLKEGVEVYGGFSATNPETNLELRDFEQNASILSTDIEGNDLGVDDGVNDGASYNDNYYHAVIAAGFDITAILDGFTIYGGTVVGYNYILVNETMIRQGFGGAFNIVDANVDFRNISINRAARPVYIRNSTANFLNLSITESTGGVQIKNSVVDIENFIYSDNAGHIYTHVDNNFPETNPSDTYLNVTNANFARNSGNPAVIRTSRSFDHDVFVNIDRAYFVGNTGRYGVMQINAGNVKISNSVASGNVMGNQSGFMVIHMHGPQLIVTVDIINSTIVSNQNNHDWWSGSGAISGSGDKIHINILNSILWGNKMGDNYINFSASSLYQNSNIGNSIIQNAFDEDGNWILNFNDLGGNSAEMPLFTEYIEATGEMFSNGNFSLQQGSLGIDAGNAVFYTDFVGDPTTALDILGNNRFSGSGIDIGAFEMIGSLSADNSQSLKELFLYPNPASENLWISEIDSPTIYEMFNLSGKLVHQGIIRNQHESISLKTLNSGYYFVRLMTKNGIKSFKFIKK